MKQGLTLLFLLTMLSAHAQEPAGYYNAATGLNGEALRAALHNIIDNQSVETYGELWDDYYTTDRKPNGKVWDMYSDVPGGTPPYEFSFGTDQCGNYNSEGDCYNREHTWPKTYFNEMEPMYTDLFIVMPTDGYVNGKRSDYPYGEVSNANWMSDNGSKLGPNAYNGSGGGTCFEPIDSFKGDLARSYFYISTRYYGEDNGWDSWAMATGADLKPWAVNMLLEWSHEDPVSQKEIDRNNAVYGLQHNRNPFIDHPEFIDCIWNPTADCGQQPSAIHNMEDISYAVNIYPNPASDQVNIETHALDNNKGLHLQIINTVGQTVWNKEYALGGSAIHINMHAFSRGVYFIKIIAGKQIAYKKIELL